MTAVPITIRPENPTDFTRIKEIIQLAFAEETHSDQTEHLLVERLRKSPAYLPELALIAELDGRLVGHILLSKININSVSSTTVALALAPVSVHPDFQGLGIGAALIQAAHDRARRLNFPAIILLGHRDYYPRFGYQLCRNYDLELPFPAPPENCMVLELQAGALKDVSGMVEYPEVFFG